MELLEFSMELYKNAFFSLVFDTSIFHLLPCKVVLLMFTRKPHIAGLIRKAASDEI